MESTSKPTSENNKTDNELAQVMSSLSVMENSDSTTKAEKDDGPLVNEVPIHPGLKSSKKRGKPLPQVRQEVDKVKAAMDVLDLIFATSFEREELANKRPKLSSDEFRPATFLSSSSASNDQDSTSVPGGNSDKNSSKETAEKVECANSSDEKDESMDPRSKNSL